MSEKFVVSRRAFLQLMGGGAVAASVPVSFTKAVSEEAKPITSFRDLPKPVDETDVMPGEEIFQMLHELNVEMENSRVPRGARFIVVPPWMYNELQREGFINKSDSCWRGTQIHWSAGSDGEFHVGGAGC
jgi:hypothetical protein